MILSDDCYKQMARKIDPKNHEDLFQTAWLKIRELEIKSDVQTNYPHQYFYLTCKSIFLDEQRKEQTRRHISLPYSDDLFTKQDSYSESIYQQALDEVLSVDNEISNLIKLYLVLPKLKEISKFTGLNYRTILKLYEDARSNIKLIADRIANNNNSSNYHYPRIQHSNGDKETTKIQG